MEQGLIATSKKVEEDVTLQTKSPVLRPGWVIWKNPKKTNSPANVTLQTNSVAVHSHTVNKKKRKRKRNTGRDNLNVQPPTLLVTDSRLKQVEDCGRRNADSLKLNCNQANVSHNHQVCAHSLDAPLAMKKRKRKRKKSLNVVSTNHLQFNAPDVPSLFHTSLDNELIQLATTTTGLVVDSKGLLRGAEQELPVKSFKEIHQSTCVTNGEISCVEGGPVQDDLKVTQEAYTNYFSKVVESDDQTCTLTIGSSQGLNAGTMCTKRKKKKGRVRNQITQTSNGQLHDNLNSLSLVSENPRYNDLVQHPVINTCLMAGSKQVQHDAGVGKNDDNDKGKKDKHTKMNAETTSETDMDPIHKVAGDEDLPCSVDISGKMVMVPLQAQKTKKKRKKKNMNTSVSSAIMPSTYVVGDPESMQHSTEQEVLKGTYQNECATMDKSCSGEDNSGIIDAKVNKILLSQDMDPNYEVAGDDDLACSFDISGKMVMGPLKAQKTKRKMNKKNMNMSVSSVIMPSTYVMGDPESMQHSTEQGVSQGIQQNECATKDKNCSGEDSCGINDAKVDEISISQDKAVGNMHAEEKRKRKIQGNNLNVEPGEGVIFSNDLLEEQQVKRAKLNADQNVGIGRMPTGPVKKKLLVLDLNGLLADVVGDKTVTIKADGHVAGKKLFKRPFCEDFLQFCFNRFTVGVWSSRRKENVDKVLEVLMPKIDRSKLAFVWNQDHCTNTGFRTLDNIDKPLFLKELSKLWKMGDIINYDKSNTLLLDDSPYKALVNPPYTAIFPAPYKYQDHNDDGLGPGGDLRVYLEGLALAEDVQEYVEQNPFGQKPITRSDPSWYYYSKVISGLSKKRSKKRCINK